MKTRRRILSIVLTIAILLLLVLDIPVTAAGTKKVDVLFTHDIHSHLDSFSTIVDGQQKEVGGFAKIKTLIDEKKKDNPDTLVLDGGDFSMGTLIQTCLLYTSLLIQLRTPKLSKDFKPSVINDILSDSLQPLSDDDLRPMSEAIENMDTMTMNLKNRKEARQAAEKIQAVFSKYNQKLLYEKAERCEQAGLKLENARTQQKEQEKKLCECKKKIEALKIEHQELDAKRESMEKEKESLNKSDAVALKRREAELITELNGQQKNLMEKQRFLEQKQTQYQDAQNQIKTEEDRKYEKEKELEELIEEMQDEADTMAFEEDAFMKEEMCIRDSDY